MADTFGFPSVVLPPRVRDSLLDAGPGQYLWRRRTLKVIKVGRNLLTIIEIDPNQKAAIADHPEQRVTAPMITLGSVLTAGTLALVVALSAHNPAQRVLLVCAAALAFVVAGVTAFFSERR